MLQEAESAQQAHNGSTAATAEMPAWLRHCLLYRCVRLMWFVFEVCTA
jgi:hypothetical protein